MKGIKITNNRQKKTPRSIVGTISKKRLKNGSYSMIVSGVVIAGAVLINLIAGELPSQYTKLDVSEQKLYTITDQTKEILKALDEDVTLYHVVQNGYEDETLQKLLERYGDASSHIKVEVKDPVVSPNFASAYTDEQLNNNSIIVVCKDKSKVVNYNSIYESSLDYSTYSYNTTGFDGEGQLTSAIAYVTSDDLPVLYVVEGHGEIAVDTTISESIKKENIDIQTLNLLTEGQIPDDADCILLNSPQSDISEQEKEYILDYLEAGGKAMIFSDYTGEDMPNFDEILENYGLQRADGLVMDTDSQHYIAQTPYYLLPDIVSNDITGDMSSSGYYVLAPLAQGIQRKESVRDTLTIESLLTTSDEAYSKIDIQSSTLEKEEGDIDGPFDLGVAVSEDVENGNQTQLVYFSTSNIANSQMDQMVAGGNSKLVLQALSWMCKSDTSSVSIPSKSLQVSRLTITAYDAAVWTILVVGIIPGAFLLIGFVIWLKRRKA